MTDNNFISRQNSERSYKIQYYKNKKNTIKNTFYNLNND